MSTKCYSEYVRGTDHFVELDTEDNIKTNVKETGYDGAESRSG